MKLIWLVALSGCGGSTPPVATAASHLALPGGGPDGVAIDYILYDARTQTVWVPAGNTGAVDVVDVATDHIAQVTGFTTQQMERKGRKRTVGPSSVTLGEPGTVYIGSRGDFSICTIDEKTLTKGTCGTIDSMPDGIVYVAKTHEVWVTAPRDQSIRILDATTLVQKARLPFDGEPEGFAVDATRNRFYTNLEDKDRTLAIALDSHATVATWEPHCGEDGPHGLRLVEPEGHLLVACSAEVHDLDVATGALAGKVAVGDGVDDLDFDPASRLVYAAGAKAASVAILALATTGALSAQRTVPTGDGARNCAIANGKIYVPRSPASELVVVH